MCIRDSGISPGSSRDFLSVGTHYLVLTDLPLAGRGSGVDNVRMIESRTLLIVAHAPSDNTQRLRDAVEAGAVSAQAEYVKLVVRTPFEANADDVRAAKALVLGTTENLGYMSGALKDFFDRVYYPCLDDTRGLPYALYIRAKLDGTGTRRAVESIASGLGWRAVQEPMICHGEWREDFARDCHELGMAMAAGLDGGIF